MPKPPAKSGTPKPPAVLPKRPAWAVELSDSELCFIQNYLVDFNATRAWMRAHSIANYNTASTSSCEKLKDPRIRRAVDAALAGGEGGSVRVSIAEFCGKVLDQDIGEVVEVDDSGRKIKVKKLSDLPRDVRRLIKRIKSTSGKTSSIEVELHDPLKAAELLGRATGMFKDDRAGVAVAVQVNINGRDADA